MNAVLEKIRKTGIIPVVVLDDAKDAALLAEALLAGGLPCAEVTFRTAAAEESIRVMTGRYPELFVGAGTVLTTEQVDRAADAGARFIVSPSCNPEIISYCLKKGLAVTPGCCSPTDVDTAYGLGLNVVKFFPAEAAGGLKMIKAIAAPYTTMGFLPTGGINAGNVRDYLAYSRVIACGGSWMVKGDLIKEGNFDKIRALTKEAADIVKEIRG